MTQPITAESLAALRQLSEILAAVCDRAAKCDHLEARNKHLQEENDSLRARHGVLQAVIRKAREGLGNAIPECRSMSLPELVIEAGARIQQLAEARAENGRQAATIAELLYADVKPAPPLRLEVGKTYVRRDGGIDTIANEDARRTIEFRFFADSFNTYREDGRFCATAEHPADLVALAPTVDPASPHP